METRLYLQRAGLSALQLTPTEYLRPKRFVDYEHLRKAGRIQSAMATIIELRKRVEQADIPLRELGSRSDIGYWRICDAFKGWVKLRDPELAALETAVNAAIRERAEKFNKLVAGLPVPVGATA